MEVFEKAKIESGNKTAQLIIGFFPIIKLKTAQFLTSHVPGITVPKLWSKSLYRAKEISETHQEEVGFNMSKDLLDSVIKIHPKVHIMSANNFSLAHRLLR